MLTNWSLIVSLFLLTLTGLGTAVPVIQPRVFAGQRTANAAIGGFAVQIFYKNRLVCTGSLITSRHLVTSAHCFENMEQSGFHVVAGLTNEFTNHSASRKNGMDEVRLHPDFRKLDFIADIAVVKTRYPLKGPTIRYAKLCGYPLFPGDMVTVAGWGFDGKRRSPSGNYLRSAGIDIVGHQECEKKIGRKMPPNILCASAYNRRTICNGDSGGPLIWKGEFCGISTWTWKCGDNKKPDVFMSVRYYLGFIKSTIQEMGF